MWLCLRYGKGSCAHYMVGLFICNHDVLFCPRQRGAVLFVVLAVLPTLLVAWMLRVKRRNRLAKWEHKIAAKDDEMVAK